jgi:2-polyprenyl-3-methyl-5-hydroxy-6-metoxy-1,4-benzoquinol methylase
MAKENKDTTKEIYTKRLHNREYKKWKSLLDVQRPYRWNIKRLQPGITLDIGCGIGRLLKYLPEGSVGVDHNKYSIEYITSLGLVGFTTSEFQSSKYARPKSFDSILLGHVLEHLTTNDGVELIKKYLKYLKNGGKVIIFCPQEKGYKSDTTHVTFLNIKGLNEIMIKAGLSPLSSGSFPFPRPFGKYFTYNEFVVVGQKSSN